MKIEKKVNSSDLKVGDKIESLDYFGYSIFRFCGIVAKISPEGDFIIKSNDDGLYYSTVCELDEIHTINKLGHSPEELEALEGAEQERRQWIEANRNEIDYEQK